MIRIPMPPDPVPDRAVFTAKDIRHTNLCAVCVISNNSNANTPLRVSSLTRGLARELFGTKIELPSGKSVRWNEGTEIPVGYDWISELAALFGTDLRLTDPNGAPFGGLVAVTTIKGTAYCAQCAYYERNRQ